MFEIFFVFSLFNWFGTFWNNRCLFVALSQEISNPPKTGGHVLKPQETQRKPQSWLSRCSILWPYKTCELRMRPTCLLIHLKLSSSDRHDCVQRGWKQAPVAGSKKQTNFTQLVATRQLGGVYLNQDELWNARKWKLETVQNSGGAAHIEQYNFFFRFPWNFINKFCRLDESGLKGAKRLFVINHFVNHHWTCIVKNNSFFCFSNHSVSLQMYFLFATESSWNECLEAFFVERLIVPRKKSNPREPFFYTVIEQ